MKNELCSSRGDSPPTIETKCTPFEEPFLRSKFTTQEPLTFTFVGEKRDIFPNHSLFRQPEETIEIAQSICMHRQTPVLFCKARAWLKISWLWYSHDYLKSIFLNFLITKLYTKILLLLFFWSFLNFKKIL